MLSAAIELQPINPAAYHMRGDLLRSTQKFKEAVADFDKALWLRPGHIETYHLRAHAHERLDQWERAQADFSAALSRRPDDAHFLDCRGRCRLKLNRVEEAIADLERCLRITPKQPAVIKLLALTYNNEAWRLVTAPESERNPAAARTLAQKAVKWQPDDQLYGRRLNDAFIEG